MGPIALHSEIIPQFRDKTKKNIDYYNLSCGLYLFSQGLRYRKNDPRLPGKPDVVLPKYRTVIFVNGCFWHAHAGCRYFVWPKNNEDFWRNKIEGNVSRDKLTTEKLQELGWNVVIVWECELKKANRQQTLEHLVLNLQQHLNNQSTTE